MADPIDTDALREAVCLRSDGVAHATILLCDEVDRLRADAMAKAHRVGELGREVDRLRTIRDLAAEALAELDAQPDLAHPDAVWYTGAALRDALEADRA